MIDLDLTDDFATVVDFLEPLTLARNDSPSTTAIAAARRYTFTTTEAAPSAGAATAADALWRFVFPAGDAKPTLGDVLVDGLGHRWTILASKQLEAVGLWECETRELRIAYGLSDRVDVERAVWVDNEGELEIESWTYIATAVPVRIQPVETLVDRTATPPTSTTRLEILFGGAIELEPEDRLVGEDGTVYWLEKLEQAERIDVLPVATVVREEG
ncbi:hypothetical protein [Adhaeretor mobilis]|uniref:Uncharacterized protein n=1 Tax=Adhaeretor mobilis TaxID=1930276 RepID=A0A517N2B2_9BACT|nr:hypothetical protein [Adhaeretor mobilis]QDT01265.1 hypothetical protein HG15A2_46070 [Adhaeretor mobilis]